MTVLIVVFQLTQLRKHLLTTHEYHVIRTHIVRVQICQERFDVVSLVMVISVIRIYVRVCANNLP